MSIQQGYYRLYYDISNDGGVTYPYSMIAIAALYVTDDTIPSGDIVETNGTITSTGATILASTNISGLFNTFDYLFAFSSSMTDPKLNEKIVNVTNWLGVAGISVSIPAIRFSTNRIDFKVYLDANKTILLKSSYTSQSPQVWLARAYISGNDLEVHMPVIKVNTANTTLYCGEVYGYARGTNANGGIKRVGYQLGNLYNDVIPLFEGISPITITTDPYGPGGTTGTGGGQGTFSNTGQNIDIPSLPTLSAVDTGFITLFNPTLAQLQGLASYMWSGLFDLNTFKKMFADPMQAVLGLSIVPVAVPNGGTRTVTVGNISTGVNMTVASTQYVEVDCGTLNVEEYWGAYLDYDPYTKCHIYLPYIGTHPISTDDIMGKAVHVVYHIDILSGACTAFVKCGESVLYEFIGQVASSIPITGDNFTNVINGVLNIAGSIGTMVATGGFSAPLSVANHGFPTAYRAGHFMSAGASVAQDVMNMKPQVEKSGGMSGTGGMLGIQVPYMILERPNQAIPVGQNDYMGYPSYITDRLGDLSGYTEIEYIHLDNVPCTELEATEILQYLESGVIL